MLGPRSAKRRRGGARTPAGQARASVGGSRAVLPGVHQPLHRFRSGPAAAPSTCRRVPTPPGGPTAGRRRGRGARRVRAPIRGHLAGRRDGRPRRGGRHHCRHGPRRRSRPGRLARTIGRRRVARGHVRGPCSRRGTTAAVPAQLVLGTPSVTAPAAMRDALAGYIIERDHEVSLGPWDVRVLMRTENDNES